MSRERRREMVDRRHPALSTVRQCTLLSISRSSLNYRRKETCPKNLTVNGGVIMCHRGGRAAAVAAV